MQNQAAEALLRRLNITCRPKFLFALLLKMDAINAIREMLSKFGFDLTELLKGKASVPEANFILREFCRAEMLRGTHDFDEEPIISTLRGRDRSQIREMLNRLNRAVSLAEAVRNTPDIKAETLEKVSIHLRNWNALNLGNYARLRAEIRGIESPNLRPGPSVGPAAQELVGPVIAPPRKTSHGQRGIRRERNPFLVKFSAPMAPPQTVVSPSWHKRMRIWGRAMLVKNKPTQEDWLIVTAWLAIVLGFLLVGSVIAHALH